MWNPRWKLPLKEKMNFWWISKFWKIPGLFTKIKGSQKKQSEILKQSNSYLNFDFEKSAEIQKFLIQFQIINQKHAKIWKFVVFDISQAEKYIDEMTKSSLIMDNVSPLFKEYR